jgi:WD40 repeat protein
LYSSADHAGGVYSVAFSPDGTKLAAGSYDGPVCIWNVETGVFLHSSADHAGGVYSVAFSPDGTKLAAGSYDGPVCIWNVETGVFLHSLAGHTDGVDSVAFSPDGTKLATGSGDGTVRIWFDTRTQNHTAASLTLLCALHERLGEDSPAQLLDTYVVHDICNLAHPGSFGPIEHNAPVGEFAHPEHRGFTRYLSAATVVVPSIAVVSWFLYRILHR